ncbi:hypothetical protein ACPYO6_06275 [Georgenia sp. Z1344]|uniref:hypothetical protein n=1 Tax=Georgenia sp. Z1344 TaxID=3416706 RepID=UPI003CF4092F
MSRKTKRTSTTTEPEQADVGAKLAELGTALSEQAKITGARAAELAQEGVDWATPKVQKAFEDARTAAAPTIEQARTSAATARDKVKDDYVPRVQKAAQSAAEAARSDAPIADRAKEASKAARSSLEKPADKKKGGAGKALGWVLVGTAVAGAGYLVWRRTQPVDDPWAEEYWDDTTVSSPTDSSGSLGDKAAGLAGKAKDAASSAAGAVKDKAADLTDRGSSETGEVSDAADAADDATAADLPVQAAGTGVTTEDTPVYNDTVDPTTGTTRS